MPFEEFRTEDEAAIEALSFLGWDSVIPVEIHREDEDGGPFWALLVNGHMYLRKDGYIH